MLAEKLLMLFECLKLLSWLHVTVCADQYLSASFFHWHGVGVLWK